MKQIYLVSALSLLMLTLGGSAVAQSYCTSSASSSIDSYISNVTFNTINNTTSACATYSDHTGIQTTVLPGVSYLLSVTDGDCDGGSVYNRGLHVYMDLNGDYDFTDPGELVINKPNSGPSTETAIVTIPPTSGGITFRLRAIATEGGVSGPCSFYTWGETEDYTVVVAPRPPYNATMLGATAGIAGFQGYTQVPLGQADSLEFTAEVLCSGTDTITGTTITGEVLNYSYSQSVTPDTLIPLQDTTVVFPKFNVSAPDDYVFRAHVSITQLDTMPQDDTVWAQVAVSDTVYARDDTTITGGLGFNGVVGEFGHLIDVINADTLTTVSFYLNSPANGTSLKAMIYKVDTIQSGGFFMGGGQYLNPYDSSRTFNVTNTNGAWYSLPIGCAGAVLTPGQYLIGLLQINPNNMSLGYTYGVTSYAGVTYFRAAGDSIWTDLKTSTSSVANAVFKIRANFGNIWAPNVLEDTTYFCFQSTTTLSTNTGYELYSWTDNSIFDTLQVSAAGTYSVTVTDENTCVYSDSITVVEHPQMGLATTITNASCGLSDGNIVALASGNFAPYSYEWDNGNMTDSIGGIAGGNYSVTATDGEGCERVENVLVLGRLPVLAGSFAYPTCAGDNDGSATVSITEGITPYTYVWQTGGSSDSETGLTAGTYSVTVTDSSGCSDNISIDVVDPDTLVLNTVNSANPTACGTNDGVANVAVTGGISPYTYFWANGQNQASNINLATGTYDVTVTDANNCVRTASVSLIDPNAPTLSGVGSNAICSYDVGDIAVTVVGGTPPFQYLWDNSSTDSNQTGVGVGLYNVSVIDAAGCIRTTQAEVIGPDPLDVTFTQEDLTGEGLCDIVTNITGGNTPYASFQWREDQGTNNVDIAGETNQDYLSAPNGLYWLVVTDAQGCLDSAQYQMQACQTGLENVVGKAISARVIPNPSSGNITVQMVGEHSGEVSLEIYNGLGKKVLSAEDVELNENTFKLNLKGLAAGMYTMTIRHEDEVQYSKFQIQR